MCISLSSCCEFIIGPATPRTGKGAIKAQVKRELEQEKKLQQQATHYSTDPQTVQLEAAPVVSHCGGVFFTCPLLPKIMLPKKEMDGEYAV